MNEWSFENKIINVFKPEGITSQGVVTAVKRALGIKTAGHCGTLDPLATGVLPVMTGRAVKASEYLTNHDKSYVARMKLGLVTDTGDITGTVVRSFSGELPDFSKVMEILPRFVGDIVQVPPMYSALKVEGKKLVDLARQGIEVERKGRKITVYSLSAEQSGEEIILNVVCSRGTYIRTLIEDIGAALGSGAVMTALCRDAVGNVSYDALNNKFVFNKTFSLENSVSFEDLKNGVISEKGVVSLEKVFEEYPTLSFPDFYERLFSNGCEIYLSKLPADNPAKNAGVGDVFRIYGKEGFFALGQVGAYQGGLAVKQIKRF
jgi:tRNA pseudouridine55 synthase